MQLLFITNHIKFKINQLHIEYMFHYGRASVNQPTTTVL